MTPFYIENNTLWLQILINVVSGVVMNRSPKIPGFGLGLGRPVPKNVGPRLRPVSNIEGLGFGLKPGLGLNNICNIDNTDQ